MKFNRIVIAKFSFQFSFFPNTSNASIGCWIKCSSRIVCKGTIDVSEFVTIGHVIQPPQYVIFCFVVYMCICCVSALDINFLMIARYISVHLITIIIIIIICIG